MSFAAGPGLSGGLAHSGVGWPAERLLPARYGAPSRAREILSPREPLRRVEAVLGPDWFLEMAAYEGIPALPASGAGVSSVLIGLEVDHARDGGAADILRAARNARSAGSKVAIWLLGSQSSTDSQTLSGYPIEWFADAEVVFTDSSDDSTGFASTLPIPVIHLPPAVQPRLQNPTGHWDATQSPASRLFDQLPERWRVLEPMAQARPLSPALCQAIAASVGEELPVSRVPSWVTASDADKRSQFLRSHYLMKHHCFAARLDEVASALDSTCPPPHSPLISVVVCTMRPNLLSEVLDGFERQTHPNKELIVVLHGDGFDTGQVDTNLAARDVCARCVCAPAKLTLGECVQRGFEESRGELIVKIDDDDWYGKLFLETQLQASLFSFAGVVGKGSYVIRFESDSSMYYLFPGREYRYMELFGGNRMLVRREVHEEIGWRALDHGEDTAFIRDCLVNSVPMYSADGYHFVIRRGIPSQHTWQISKSELLATHQGVRLADTAGLHDFDPEPL